MSDYDYTTRDSKTIPLYHHEQVPFPSFIGNSDMSPTLAKELPLNPNSSSSGDLQEIICSYQSQPDLLKLILMSKLEEDKRRAEEAKLRAKELDLLLLQQQQQQSNTDYLSFNTSLMSSSPPPQSNSPYMQQQQQQPTPPLTAATPSSTNSSTFDSHNNNMRRTSFSMLNDVSSVLLSSSNQCSIPTSNPFFQQEQRRESNICSSFTDSDDFDDHTFSSIHTSSTPVSSASSTLFNMDSMMATASFNDEKSILPYSSCIEKTEKHAKYENISPSRPRRRREMQAITKIVETREYPYLDGYFWKNNGNTVQKKTGNKSVYYKCSNSNKGCPVNKTVTWKEHGEFLIKYRGEHLSECNKVQRIVDV
ncbi:hypothetical protein K501DRAFT_321888 [Backusella circina FSU 941]|nr:hypothetical protein K501DRAFT_321888 [Backusella circina FSU 941]